ncbi:hypothetical protein SteCoe_27936 [Stentor coeruleus]|uniref:RanBP2-type domain-containing protein n=1 Tax=Stentor coeruleus TaxID=5963 RepID=A0A1R2B9C3_9CILI|nr:hypothetical protein SteCoe_27936 [Stentor coeruleus]
MNYTMEISRCLYSKKTKNCASVIYHYHDPNSGLVYICKQHLSKFQESTKVKPTKFIKYISDKLRGKIRFKLDSLKQTKQKILTIVSETINTLTKSLLSSACFTIKDSKSNLESLLKLSCSQEYIPLRTYIAWKDYINIDEDFLYKSWVKDAIKSINELLSAKEASVKIEESERKTEEENMCFGDLLKEKSDIQELKEETEKLKELVENKENELNRIRKKLEKKNERYKKYRNEARELRNTIEKLKNNEDQGKTERKFPIKKEFSQSGKIRIVSSSSEADLDKLRYKDCMEKVLPMLRHPAKPPQKPPISKKRSFVFPGSYWICSCGNKNEDSFEVCKNCRSLKQIPQVWKCDICGFINRNSTSAACQYCQQEKSPITETSLSVSHCPICKSQLLSDAKKCPNCKIDSPGYSATPEKKVPSKIMGKRSGSTGDLCDTLSNQDMWICQSCGMVNQIFSPRCLKCSCLKNKEDIFVEGGKWKCVYCSVLNSQESKKCAECLKSRPYIIFCTGCRKGITSVQCRKCKGPTPLEERCRKCKEKMKKTAVCLNCGGPIDLSSLGNSCTVF